MDNQTKERIIEFNKRFGLNTEFITDESVLGYALNNTIYINESIEQDYERTNKHELLHFFEDTEEFQKLKQDIFEANKENLEQIRSEYELRYFGLYSEDEINAGVLDNEIAIDLLIDNSVIEYEDGLKIGDEFLGNIEHELEEKRYLNLTLNNNIKNMNLSKWEKIFVANYYDGKERRIPQGKNKQEAIKRDIDASLQKLYEMGEADFKIDVHSPEVIREYESEINALKQRGEDTSYLEANKESALKELAEKFSKQLWEEYKHIVDFIKNEDYEPSFKYLMLKETLTKTYKKDKSDGKDKTIVKKRDLHKSVAGHMVLNRTTLDVIYNNLENYDNFANLYFAGLEIFNKTIAERNGISLEGVETYGKGKWLRFEGKESNEAEYLKNAEKLASLVKDTPWCTKTLASTQLAEGDFFVFVDNDGKPHIAVKMSGEEIDEVRGIQNGNAQELEEDYRDVALSFLENNKDIKNGKEWLEKEEWNKRLIEYNRKIDAGELKKEDIPGLIHDLFEITDYRSHGGENSNKVELKKKFEKIKGTIADYYECSEDEIWIGDINFSETDYEVCPYKVIFGNAEFGYSQVIDLGNLECIGGNANFEDSQITDLKNLQRIGGDAYFKGSQITDLGKIKIYGEHDYNVSKEVNQINKLLMEYNRKIERGNIEKEEVQDLINCVFTIMANSFYVDKVKKNLENIKNMLAEYYECGEEEIYIGDMKFSKTDYEICPYKVILGRANFLGSQITDLGNLKIIKGGANFYGSQVTNLGNLQVIENYADFSESKITDLGMLQTINGMIFWGDRDDLRMQYEARQAEKARREQEELMKIAKEQRKDDFFEFVDEVTDRVNGRENEDIEVENRGEEVDD